MSDGQRLSRRDLLRGRFFPPRDPPAATAEEEKTAVVLAWSCLAHRGTFCTTCVEHCPVEGAMQLVGGRPVIDAEICTGCGDCVEVCPSPSIAIALRPRIRQRKRGS